MTQHLTNILKRIFTPTVAQRLGPKVGRNDPCPCGSGKKFKKCCLGGRPIRKVQP